MSKDDALYHRWTRKSAEQGYAMALSGLGDSYYHGEGVIKDEVEGYAFWYLAAITDNSRRTHLAWREQKLSKSVIASGKKRAIELQKELDEKKTARQPVSK